MSILPDTDLPLSPPLLMMHVACSGGSVIYRKLCEKMNLWGVSEVSTFAGRPDRNFSPQDPLFQLKLNGHLTGDEFLEIFDRRLCECAQRAEQQGHHLLIREHTHSLLFQDQIQFRDGSWIAGNSALTKSPGLHLLLTVRDPIDSWLGFQNEFGHLVQYDFDEYCQRYLLLLDGFDQMTGITRTLIRYEHFVTNFDDVLVELAEKWKWPVQSSPTSAVVASGNSGRQSNTLALRPRRSFSHGLVQAAKKSDAYHQLIRRLDYDNFYDSMSPTQLLATRFNSIRKKSYRSLVEFAKWGKSQIKKRSVAD